MVDEILDLLEQRGLLSDARAAEAMLHARAPRYGTRRLRQALQARALPAELVEDALQRTQASEEARACAVWRRRFGAPPPDAREFNRQLRFLLGRGFDAELARRVIRRGGVSEDGDAWGRADEESSQDPIDSAKEAGSAGATEAAFDDRGQAGANEAEAHVDGSAERRWPSSPSRRPR
ncbi:MAG TPA: regulatory protein RecX [Rubrivivax sp.]|nr:regulatory protein RecX [Rubrivivax sp.]